MPFSYLTNGADILFEGIEMANERKQQLQSEINHHLEAVRAMLTIFAQADTDEESQAFIQNIQGAIGRLEGFWREYSSLSASPTAADESAPLPLTRNGKPLAVLVVDDDAVQQVFVSRILQRAGAQVTVSANGSEALGQLRTGRFDVVLMDCQMPILDGFAAVGAIRASESPGKHVPIIAFTAHTMAGYKQRCLQVGMDTFLLKPATAEVIVKTVTDVLNAKQKR